MAKVAVIGTGTMGRGIAQLIASSGIDVVLMGRTSASAESARNDIAARVEKKQPDRASTILGHLEASEIEQQRGTSFEIVIEAIVEDFSAKVDLLRQVAPMSRVLATNTSSLSVSELGAAVGLADRVIGLHFFNPPAAMKLVELVMGLETGANARAVALWLVTAIGRTVIGVNDSPGFVVNRLLFAQLAEACRAFDAGVATTREIDDAMTIGLGHPMGPFALMDLIGLDVCRAIFDRLSTGIDGRFHPPQVLSQLVIEGRLGKKTGRGFYEYPIPVRP